MILLGKQANAVSKAHEFLLALCDVKQTPRVPRSIRKQAQQMLENYPTKFRMDAPTDDLSVRLQEDDGEIVVPVSTRLIKKVGWNLGDELVFEQTLLCMGEESYPGLTVRKKLRAGKRKGN